MSGRNTFSNSVWMFTNCTTYMYVMIKTHYVQLPFWVSCFRFLIALCWKLFDVLSFLLFQKKRNYWLQKKLKQKHTYNWYYKKQRKYGSWTAIRIQVSFTEGSNSLLKDMGVTNCNILYCCELKWTI